MEEKDIPGQKAESPDEALNAAGKEAAAMKEEGPEAEAGQKAPAAEGAAADGAEVTQGSDSGSAIDESEYSTFIVKLFPEIVVKSKPVRTRMIRILPELRNKGEGPRQLGQGLRQGPGGGIE